MYTLDRMSTRIRDNARICKGVKLAASLCFVMLKYVYNVPHLNRYGGVASAAIDNIAILYSRPTPSRGIENSLGTARLNRKKNFIRSLKHLPKDWKNAMTTRVCCTPRRCFKSNKSSSIYIIWAYLHSPLQGSRNDCIDFNFYTIWRQRRLWDNWYTTVCSNWASGGSHAKNLIFSRI
jgi:hypothetical protein